MQASGITLALIFCGFSLVAVTLELHRPWQTSVCVGGDEVGRYSKEQALSNSYFVYFLF